LTEYGKHVQIGVESRFRLAFIRMSAREILRQDLYDLISSRPVSKVAVQFGVSDVAVEKACRKTQNPAARPRLLGSHRSGAKATSSASHKSRERASRRDDRYLSLPNTHTRRNFNAPIYVRSGC